MPAARIGWISADKGCAGRNPAVARYEAMRGPGVAARRDPSTTRLAPAVFAPRTLAALCLLIALALLMSGCSAGAGTAGADLYPQGIGDTFGYIDKTGEMVIPPLYDDATLFGEGLASVQVDGAWGCIDPAGNMVIAPQYEEPVYFSEGLAAVLVDGHRGYIDKTGRMVIPAEYADAGDFAEGLAPVREKHTYGYIDRTGTMVIPDRFGDAYPFSDGLALVWAGTLYGYIDKSGEYVIAPQFADAWDFHEGLAAVQRDQRWGYVDKAGKEVIPSDYDEAGDFHEGLAAVKQGLHWGFVDKAGSEVIPITYLDASYFDGGLAPVQRNDGLWGYLDPSERWAIAPRYKGATEFYEGLAIVWMDEEESWYIDRQGQEIPVHERDDDAPPAGPGRDLTTAPPTTPASAPPGTAPSTTVPTVEPDWVRIQGDTMSLSLPDTFRGGDPYDDEVRALIGEAIRSRPGLHRYVQDLASSDWLLMGLGPAAKDGTLPTVVAIREVVPESMPLRLYWDLGRDSMAEYEIDTSSDDRLTAYYHRPENQAFPESWGYLVLIRTGPYVISVTYATDNRDSWDTLESAFWVSANTIVLEKQPPSPPPTEPPIEPPGSTWAGKGGPAGGRLAAAAAGDRS
jgi:hypothetical protein